MIVNCLIPARGGSKRIPRKNLIDFCGKPLIVWSIEQALAAKGIDKAYVSSEDAEILGVANLHGAEMVVRPAELAQDNSTLEQVIEHFLKEVPTDILVVLQPTSPLRLLGDIDRAIEYFRKTKLTSLFSSHIETDLFLSDSNLMNITFEVKSDYRQVKDHYIVENGSYYIFTQLNKGFFYRNRYSGYLGYYPMQKWQSYEIDEPEDVRVCEALMKEFIIK
jgi:N-acylneuraminate cytidylyltransferase